MIFSVFYARWLRKLNIISEIVFGQFVHNLISQFLKKQKNHSGQSEKSKPILEVIFKCEQFDKSFCTIWKVSSKRLSHQYELMKMSDLFFVLSYDIVNCDCLFYLSCNVCYHMILLYYYTILCCYYIFNYLQYFYAVSFSAYYI